ncbi:VOC family protein [Streptomyces sp. SP17KL33]|uniref:VOC family protein n=1 Tax=Streptomyces sp. SP17KL33 TaxID=3002534 RepID=UPI002E78A234|nr:VOC family protein [Streptomyces sp. SP17KL33]MEE1836089.1 VOC family protein [Streptomyces sp. SP17KL33]
MTRPFEVGVVVRDLAVMERFYRDVIGCRAVRRSRVPESVGGPAGLGGELVVAWLQVPSGGCVKLLLPSSPVAPAPEALGPAGRMALSYLTFHFDDMGPVVAALTAAGARPLSDPVVVPARGRRVSFWSDPEGNVVELVDACGQEPGTGRSN